VLDKYKLRFRKWVAKRLDLKIVKPRDRSDGDEPPSHHFRSAVFTGSGLRVTCSICRRCFFCSWGDYSPGELEELRDLAAREPERYFEVEDFTQCGDVDGKQIPLFCPCNGLRRYEDFIWDHREMIAQYLADRAKSMRTIASLEVATAAKIAHSIQPLPRTEDDLI